MTRGADGSVAPKERINIVFKPAGSDQQEDVELPFKMLVVGEFEGKTAPNYVDSKAGTISVDNRNFNDVLKSFGVGLNYKVKNQITENKDKEIDINLDIENLKDFSPDNVLNHVPELKKVLDLKHALLALKGPLGNTPAMRQTIKKIISNKNDNSRLRQELNLLEKTNN